MEEVNEVQHLLNVISAYMDKCKEYLIPYDKEDEIIELDKKHGVVNLSVNRLVEGKEVSEILRKYKIPHSLDYVQSLKFIDVYIPVDVEIDDYITSSNKYVITHSGTETVIVI